MPSREPNIEMKGDRSRLGRIKSWYWRQKKLPIRVCELFPKSIMGR